MCEPAHSIVQYPKDYDDTNLPYGGNMDKQSRLTAALGNTCKWAKSIGKWFHLSKFGAGHSEATQHSAHTALYLPEPNLFEGEWWNRSFHYDGWNRKRPDQDAHDAAQEYHNRSTMGNMSLFRRFLETSMKNGQRPLAYIDLLLSHVLTQNTTNKINHKFKRVFGQPTLTRIITPNKPIYLERGIKLIMGYTRNRNNFRPHFADDTNLWD